MIDESLIKSNFIGRDSFRWWVGQIAPIESLRKQNKGEGWGNRYKVRILGYHPFSKEDLPDKENRITLSKKETDKFGMPAAKWIYQLSENSKLLLDFGIRKAKEVMIEAGAVETFENRLKNQAGFHIMGTTGMGVDPMLSVTNPLGQCHDHKNLFVADSSLFVTASCLNPTLTAQALALRLVDSNL